MPGTGFPKLGATAASVPSRNSVPCSPVTAGPVSRSRWAQAWHLGLCDYQVPGDLESSNEGTELNLLVGANRESVPKEIRQKVRIESITDKRTRQSKDGQFAAGGAQVIKLDPKQ